jgi:exonuclease SbcC
MLKSIHIQNFEAHTDTFLELDKGINNISGSSNNGKSSIIKALNWCFFNQPAGFSFKKHNSKGPTVVKVVFEDRTYLERKRDTQTNQYDCNGTILTALGSGVPEKVLELTKIEPINMQGQFDQFYLLQESSGEVARTLNGIVGLSIIDSALYKSGSIVKDTKRKVATAEDQLKEKNNTLEDYKWVDEAVKSINETEEYQRVISQINEHVQILQQLNYSWEEISDKISNLFYIDENKLNETYQSVEECQKIDTSFSKFQRLVDDLFVVRRQISDLAIPSCGGLISEISNLIKEIKYMDEYELNLNRLLNQDERRANAYQDTEQWLSCKPLLNEVSGYVENVNKYQSSIDEIGRDIDHVREINEGANKIMSVIDKHRMREQEIKQEVKICPVCDKPFDGECC